MSEKLCPCGKPLHYTNPTLQLMIESQVQELGESVVVTVIESGRRFQVSRHYIALHGVKGTELPGLVGQFGIEEITTTLSDVFMSTWTVYWNPRDYPEKFVARRFVILRRSEEPQPTTEFFVADTLEAIREKLWEIDPNLSCLPRWENDEAQIVEVWL